MKPFVYGVAVAFAFALQTHPALASLTAPSVQLIPLSPERVAVGSPDCNADAAIDGTPWYEVPPIAQQENISGTSQVEIHLSASGNLVEASLYASSGNRSLDWAALTTARRSRYIPETVNCQHVAGSYLVQVNF